MTAHAMKGDGERCLAAGMDAYLAKPLEMSQLRSVLASLGTGRVSKKAAAQAAAAADRALVDEPRLLERVGGDRKALAKLVRLFLADSQALVARIREAVERGSAQDLRSAAHALKGSVANFAAPTATAAAARLQEMGERGDLTEASLGQANLEQELTRVRARLQALVAGGAGGKKGRSVQKRGQPDARRGRSRRLAPTRSPRRRG